MQCDRENQNIDFRKPVGEAAFDAVMKSFNRFISAYQSVWRSLIVRASDKATIFS
jgi:hypothetical protein